MILQGFETREDTDIPVRALVKSASGILHKKLAQVGQYEITPWAKFSLQDGPICVFGHLRGTGGLIAQCINLKQDFYYFDHAYLFGNRHEVSSVYGEKVYRLTKNWFHIRELDSLTSEEKKRVKPIADKISLKPWSKEGDYILICPPSSHTIHYFNLHGWLDNVLSILKKNTDRRIKVREWGTTSSLEEDIDNSFAVITSQSTVAIHSIIRGKPSFCDKISMALPVSLTNFNKIESPIYPVNRFEFLQTLLANQFTMSEIKNGYAWDKVK